MSKEQGEEIAKANNMSFYESSAKSGEGTLGKLLGDEKLYNELVKTNLDLQNLVNDIEIHPERYIHFSVMGSKTKSPFTNREERRLKDFLDTIPQ